MGNDIRIIKPSDLAILSNAAIIAINQDPEGNSATRKWMYTTDDIDADGRAAIQLWTGSLKSTTGGDYDDMVVLFINGNNKPTVMNATLADIFIDSGPSGTAAQVEISWEVRDLWANRMSNAEAQEIISISSATRNATTGYNATTAGAGRYNATKRSYAEGLAQNDPIILGNITTTVKPSGTVVATVDPHGAAMFRLRAVPTAVKRDEL